MTIPTNKEHLDNGSPSGCRVRGLAGQVINPAGTTQTLTVGQSGSLCVFDTAAGQIYTLPVIGADDVGMFFDFTVTLDATSNSYTVNTGSAANFIGGGIAGQSTTAGGGDFFPATIASTVSIDLDAAETGWLIGGSFRLTAISTTQWSCAGITCGSGTLATPFA